MSNFVQVIFKKFTRKLLPWLVLGLIFGGLATTSWVFYQKHRLTQEILADPNKAKEEEIRILVDKVGKLIELPADEQPTLATVIDAEKLKDQAFFVKASDGDRVLLYQQARKAILYRPGENKIIEVATLNLGPEE